MESAFLKRKSTRWGGVFCALGLALAILVVYVNAMEAPVDRSFTKVSLDFLLFGATTLLSLGLVSMILDMKAWKEYFEGGLLNIVLRPEFLKKLSQEQLTDYQIEVFKKYYKREDIDQEGRFLRYCLQHIHKYIAAPYREVIREEMRVNRDSVERLRISETLRYVCRTGEGGIQQRLAWGMNDETLEVQTLRFELKLPEDQPQVSEKLVWNKEELQTELDNGLTRYWLDLKPYRQMDRLEVTIDAIYLVDQKQFNTWRMVVPSRDVLATIRYPEDLRLQFIPFLLDSKPDHETNDPGFYSAEFRSWIMPQSGFAWKLFPRGSAEAPAFIPKNLEEPGAGLAVPALN